MTVTLRLAAPADLPAVAAVHIESCLDIYRPFVSAEVISTTLPNNLKAVWAAETLANGDFIVMAEAAGEAIGLVTVRAREPAYIDHFHVRPARKGGGVGRLLMRAAVEEMRRRGMAACYLDVHIENEAALNFYRAMGGAPGEEVVGDLFGHEARARIVRWPDLNRVTV